MNGIFLLGQSIHAITCPLFFSFRMAGHTELPEDWGAPSALLHLWPVGSGGITGGYTDKRLAMPQPLNDE